MRNLSKIAFLAGVLALGPAGCASCAPDRVGMGVAQLSAIGVGALLTVISNDTTCGFQSQAVIAAGQVTGRPGQPGEVVYKVSQCAIDLGPRHTVSKDCAGTELKAGGKAIFTGTMRLRGTGTGSPTQPIAPSAADDVQLDLTAQFDGFSAEQDDAVITLEQGGVSWTAKPLLAASLSTGLCTVQTSDVSLLKVSYDPSVVHIHAEGNDLDVPVESSNFTVQVGRALDGTENTLSGTISVYGHQVSLPQGDGRLDSRYSRDTFEQGFSCVTDLKTPVSYSCASFQQVLAENAARLLVEDFIAMAYIANADDSCGFSSLAVEAFPSQATGDDGQMGSLTWDIHGCGITQSPAKPWLTDCLDTRYYSSGKLTMDARRVVSGRRSSIYLVFKNIAPTSPQAVELDLQNVTAKEYTAYHVAPGQAGPQAQLILHSGRFSGVFRPVMGENASAPGTFQVETPIAGVTLQATNVEATLSAEGIAVPVHITNGTLSAFNGSYHGQSNQLSGVLEIGGQSVQLGNLPLEPAFNQVDFNASYACVNDLRAVLSGN